MYNLVIEFLASLLIWLLFAGLLVLWVIDGKIKKETVLHAIFAFTVAWITAQIIKKIIPVDRPYLLNGHTPLTLTGVSLGDGSFPSGHTASAFAMATTIWFHDRKVGWLYLFFSFVVGVARILANVHYPVDILGGAFIGVITSFAVERIHLFNLLVNFRRRIKI